MMGGWQYQKELDLCFWNTLIWLQLLSLLFTPAPGSVVFTIINVSYFPEHLELRYLSHKSWWSYWFYLPACLQSYFGWGRLAVNKVHFPLPVSGVQQAASHSGQILLTPKRCQQNHWTMHAIGKRKSFPSNYNFVSLIKQKHGVQNMESKC